MGDTSIEIYNSKDEEIEVDELKTYFDEEVYRAVDFYVNSDGHYQGESGVVKIILNEEDEDEHFFDFSKEAKSEFSEQYSGKIEVELDKEIIEFIKENVLNINGGGGGFDGIATNYKKDFILTDKQEEILSQLEAKLDKEASEWIPEEDGELEESYSFTTNEEGKKIIFKKNKLKLNVTRSITIYKDSD